MTNPGRQSVEDARWRNRQARLKREHREEKVALGCFAASFLAGILWVLLCIAIATGLCVLLWQAIFS